MTAIATTLPTWNPLSLWYSDGWTVTKRNLIKIKRSPDMLVFAVIQPIMFVVLFSQVYAGAIQVQGTDYVQFLMAGIFAQTVVFGATFSGAAMAQDLKEGIIDRFRSLPMAASAVTADATVRVFALLGFYLSVMQYYQSYQSYLSFSHIIHVSVSVISVISVYQSCQSYQFPSF